MNKILLIDDDLALTDLLSEYLATQGFEVSVENHPKRGIDNLCASSLQKPLYDVLLLDVMMPDIDGFEVLKQIRQFSVIPVIMLTAKGDDFDRILGLELGADDYLPKPFNQRELVARIKALIRRLSPSLGLQTPQKIQLHGIEVNEASQSVSIATKNIVMTGTEFSLLLHLMKHVGVLQSKEVLSEAVLHRKLSAFDRSLDMHVSNIRKKLANEGIENVITTIRGNGYFMQHEDKA